MKKIAFTNQKGGVAKSSSCINMAAVLGDMGHRVLVIDIDPQANASLGLGIEWESLEGKTTIYDCITKEIPIKEAIVDTEFKNVYIVPSYITLANAEIEISSLMGRENLLNESIINSNLENDFDYILLDLPPTLGLLSVNALAASDELIIPIDAGVFALAGIKQLLGIISMVKKKLKPNLNICGVLFTKVNSRTKLSKELYSELEGVFKSKLFRTVIHQSVKVAEAQGECKPILYFDRNSKPSQEYIEATKELVEKLK
jgi:chromosome partitioning protein